MRSNIRFVTTTIEDRRLLFSPLSVVCEQYSGKSPRRISTKLGGGVRYGPRIMPLNFFASILSSGGLSSGGQLHRRYSHGVGFQFSLRFSCVLQSERFYGSRSANPATKPPKKVTQLQDIRRRSWAQDMDGRWLTRSSSAL